MFFLTLRHSLYIINALVVRKGNTPVTTDKHVTGYQASTN